MHLVYCGRPGPGCLLCRACCLWHQLDVELAIDNAQCHTLAEGEHVTLVDLQDSEPPQREEEGMSIRTAPDAQ